MKSVVSSLAVLVSLSVSCVNAANFTSNPQNLTCPHDNPIRNSTGNATEIHDNGYLSVTGVQGTEIHPRLEVRELEKDPIMWNLFLQAFAKFQAMDQKSKRSYFQISAIHGAPFVTWDGVEPLAGNDQMGYCPHSSSIFGTWHRPYLALFEQLLHEHAKEIADKFTGNATRAQYQQAAAKLRLPYWDWALDPPNPNEGAFPECFRRPTAMITVANGTQMEIPNPLFQYKFHPLNPPDFAALDASGYKFSQWGTTIRDPINHSSLNVTSRNDEVNKRITAQQVNNRNMLYKLLSVYQPFNEWSTKSGGGKIGNVETLHDGIHVAFQTGHMGFVETSAMDPAFWLHHCNVDRIVAIYQHRYPDSYVSPASQLAATYTTPREALLDASSPLSPFHTNTNGSLWTSHTVRNTTTFGYTYPEHLGSPSNSTLTQTINKLYSPPVAGLQNSTSLRRRAHNSTSDATDWMAEVNLPSDYETTYSVRAFLGPPDEDPENWATDPNYVGMVASLTSPRMDGEEEKVIVTANIMLTERLQEKFEKGELASLEKPDVEAYLKDNFFWRIQKLDNTVIPRADPPPGLNVTVISVPIHLPESEHEVPEWTGDFDYKTDIGGQPPPTLLPNGTEPEVVTEIQTVWATVTAVA